jgi:hypothetical protein
LLAADHEQILAYPPAPYPVKAYLRLYADYQRFESGAPRQSTATIRGTRMYQCRDASGRTEFREMPCATGLGVV